MSDLEKKSIECIKNMPIEETTYQVARNVVLDYITNLQQENERLKTISYDPEETDNNWTIEESELVKAFKERNDYKSKVEKAVEYMNGVFQRNEDGTDNIWVLDFYEILNILNGDEEKESK